MSDRAAAERWLEEFERRRDEDSFAALYRCHTPRLFALAMRLTGGRRRDAEEIVQEAWIRAVERLEVFRRESTFSTWLSGIVVNCHRERSRFLGREPAQIEDGESDRAVLRLARFPRSESRVDPLDLERAISRLPSGFREVLVLHDVHGYLHREIAELLGIEDSTSRSQLQRARRRLRSLLLDEAPPRPKSKENGHD